MIYYKVIDQNIIIGVATQFDLCKQMDINGTPTMICCDIEEAQYVIVNNEFYHSQYLRPETIKGLYPSVDLVEIDKDMYLGLKEMTTEDIVFENITEEFEEPVESDENKPSIQINSTNDIFATINEIVNKNKELNNEISLLKNEIEQMKSILKEG